MLRQLFALLLLSAPAFAQAVTPNFTQGSMTSTTTTTQTIDETITTTKYGGAMESWSGTNVKVCTDAACGTSTHIKDTNGVYQIHTVGDDWSLELQTRAANVKVEEIEIEREIEIESTTTSLSVFSQ